MVTADVCLPPPALFLKMERWVRLECWQVTNNLLKSVVQSTTEWSKFLSSVEYLEMPDSLLQVWSAWYVLKSRDWIYNDWNFNKPDTIFLFFSFPLFLKGVEDRNNIILAQVPVQVWHWASYVASCVCFALSGSDALK